jgi:hypothetical protein
MSSRTTITLAAAIILGTALTASAATVHRRPSDADPPTYNTGGPSPPVIRVAPSPPAIARRPAAHLAAPLVCRPALPASQDTTPGDERGWMG